MNQSMRVWATAAVVAINLCVGHAFAQEWGDKMFDKHQINFGNVARMADTTFKLVVTNPYVEEIKVTNLSTSCGCISWQNQTPISIPSRGKVELTIRLDTVRHFGEKHVRAFATLNEPTKGSTAIVTIPVDGRIRDDFEVRPGSVAFGSVDSGQIQTRKINITSNRAAGWKLTSAKTNNEHLTTRIVEQRRPDGLAQYEVQVDLKPDAPLGMIRDELILSTNQPGSSPISIPIEGRVEPDIIVTDARFGIVNQSQSKTVTIVMRGKKPFQIEKVDHVIQQVAAKPVIDGVAQASGTSNSEAITADASDALKVDYPKAAGAVQTLTLTLSPLEQGETGLFDEIYSVTVAGRSEPILFHANGRIRDQQ